MDQFVIALLIGGFFSTLVIFLQIILDVRDDAKKIIVVEEEEDTFETSTPYCARPFRDPKNQPWIFRDSIIVSIVNYFRDELTSYKGDFFRDENIEISTMLCDKTPYIEAFIRESKRGKFDGELFDKICDFRFKNHNAAKSFLLTSVFKEAHNSLIDDLIAGKLKC